MIDEEARRLRAYQIWESEGRPEGQELAHWYQAADIESGPAGEGAHYWPYSSSAAPAGSLVIKFYNSGDQIRGYLRKVADTAKDDAIFPGEEMEPDAAFRLAKSHNSGSGQPVFIELVEGVNGILHGGPSGMRASSKLFRRRQMTVARGIILPPSAAAVTSPRGG
jgi:hypothetical protein